MYFKNRLSATLCIATLVMVAPTTAYTNLNTNQNSIDDAVNSVEANTTVGAWFTPQGLHPNTDTLVNAISNAANHGLNPQSYQLSSLEQELEKFVEKSEQLGGYSYASTAAERKSLEKRLYKAFTNYVSDLGRGALDAQKPNATYIARHPQSIQQR